MGLWDQKGKNTHESRDFRSSDILKISEEPNWIRFDYSGKTVKTPLENVRQIVVPSDNLFPLFAKQTFAETANEQMLSAADDTNQKRKRKNKP